MATVAELKGKRALLLEEIAKVSSEYEKALALDVNVGAEELKQRVYQDIASYLKKLSPILQKVYFLSDDSLVEKSGEIHYCKKFSIKPPSYSKLQKTIDENKSELISYLKVMASDSVDGESLEGMGLCLETLYFIKANLGQYDSDFKREFETFKANKADLIQKEHKELLKKDKALQKEIEIAQAKFDQIKSACLWDHEPSKSYEDTLLIPLGYNEFNGLSWDVISDGVYSIHTEGGEPLPALAYSLYQGLFLKFFYSYPHPDRKILYLSKKTHDGMNNFLSMVKDALGKDAFYDGIEKIDSFEFDDKINETMASLRRTIEERSALLNREGLTDILEHNKNNPENRKPLILVVLNAYPDGFERLYDMEYVFSNASKTGIFIFTILEKTDLKKNAYSDETLTDPSSYSSPNKKALISDKGLILDGRAYTTLSFKKEDLRSLLEPLKVQKKVEKSVLGYEDVGFGKEKIAPSEIKESISIPVGRIDDKIYNIEFAVSGSDDSKPIAYLLIGSPKMGKSSLIDSMIYNGSMKYSPDDLNFYLIDFKDGVSSAQYANDCKMPHIKVLAESSKQEEAEIILRTLINEQSRRNSLFKKEKGCKNLVDYNAVHEKHLPRIIVVIDEVQKLFKEDSSDYGRSDRLAGYLEQIVREGRSAGLHVVLASQDASRKMMMCVGKFVPGRFCFGAAYEDAENILSRDNAKRVVAECTKPGIALVSHDSGNNASKVKIAYHGGKEITYADQVRRKWRDYPIDVAVVGEDGPLYIEEADQEKVLFDDEKPSFPIGESFFDHSVANLSFDTYHHSCFMLGENEHVQCDILRNLVIGAYREGACVSIIDESRDLSFSNTFIEKDGVGVYGAGDYLDELGKAYIEFKKRSRNRRQKYQPYFLIIDGLSTIDDFMDNVSKNVSEAPKEENKPASSFDLGDDDWGDLPLGFDLGLQSSFASELGGSSSISSSSSTSSEMVYGRDTLFKMLSSMNKANDFYIIIAADKTNALRSSLSQLSECDYRIVNAPFVDTMESLLGNLYKKSLASSCNENIILVSEKGQALMKMRYFRYEEDPQDVDDFVNKYWERRS